MAVFKVETKNQVDVDKKPRVYFTCHPDDFEKYFGKVCEDIFKTHDCAIYYTEDMIEKIAEDEKEVDLGRNNLFVVPVTKKLLSTRNRTMDEDIPYAFKEHIPVLPIMMETGIDSIYSQPDKFGELQYLKSYSTDITEISYEEKLKKYLESVLISDELAKRIRAAFDAYIFLSYRKKDRKYANELMKLIHSNPECRDIAIWFDEFLTPGESFKETIEKIIDDCKLFTLLVTPHLLEKVIDTDGEEIDNYVISTELPLARKKKEEKGTGIFVVEMEETDKEKLSAVNIEEYVNVKDESFRTRLLEAISQIAVTKNNTPEHNFLIGLAYLEGIDVEVDRDKGMELIVESAESDLLEAIRKMIEFCNLARFVDKDEIIKWLNKAVLVAEQEYRNTQDNYVLDNLLVDIEQLFDLQMHYKVHNAKDTFVRMVAFDLFLRENELYQKQGDSQKLFAACSNLFRHRSKKYNMYSDRDDGYRDFEEWLMAYEKLVLRESSFAKGVLATAYLNYAEVLEKQQYNLSIVVVNKLLQLALSEATKTKVELHEDYTLWSCFDVPEEVRIYTYWLEMASSGYLHIVKICEQNQKLRLSSIKKTLELLECLRGHAITYTTCSNAAECYRILGQILKTIGKIDLSQKSDAYASLIEEGISLRKKSIPILDAEIYKLVDDLIGMF